MRKEKSPDDVVFQKTPNRFDGFPDSQVGETREHRIEQESEITVSLSFGAGEKITVREIKRDRIPSVHLQKPVEFVTSVFRDRQISQRTAS